MPGQRVALIIPVRLKLFSFQIFILLFFGTSLYGQILIKKRPKGYLVPDGTVLSKRSEKLTNDIRQSAWSVMADSAGRVIYKDKNCKKRIRVSDYLEPFFVVGESKKSLLLATYNDTIPISGKVSKSSVIGWMLKSDLILWDFGLCDPVTGVMKRLYPVHKENVSTTINPSIHLLTSEKKLDSSRFYFLVKKRGKKNLMAKNSVFSADFKEAIIGWFPSEQFTEITFPSGLLFSSFEPLDTFLKARNIILVKSLHDKVGMLNSHGFILLDGNNFLFPNLHYSNDTSFKRISGSKGLSSFTHYFSISDGTISSFKGFEIKSTFKEQRGLFFKAVVIPKAVISEMNELYVKQVRSFDVSSRKELAEGLKSTFSRLSFGFSKSSFSYNIGTLKQFFGSRIIIPKNMEKRKFDDVLSRSKIKDEDLQYFINRLEDVLNPEKDILLPFYSFLKGDDIIKYFPINQFD